MIECHCVKCGHKLDAILFSPSKLFVKCPICSTLLLIKLTPDELSVKVKSLRPVSPSSLKLTPTK